MCYDVYSLNILNLEILIILKYFLTILLLVTNTVFIYQYKLKNAFRTKLDKETEMLKVKWLANLFLSFGSPMFVFMFNQTPNYSILRFNKSPLVIVLIGVAIIIYFINSTFLARNKIDINSINMR